MLANEQTREVMDAIAAAGPPPNTKSPEEAKGGPSPADAAKEVFRNRTGREYEPEAVSKVEETEIPGPGGDLTVRAYTPEGAPDGASPGAPYPVLVYYHGGGWVLFDLDVYDASCRALANAAGCVVVSVDYRQAPEYRFPAAHEDAYAAYLWARENAATLGGDPDRVAVGGESAGGNLATAVCLMARDRGAALPVYQILVYPITDRDFSTSSYEEQADAVPLSRELMRWFWDTYLPEGTEGELAPYAYPLRAPDLSGLPPATVITAEIDPLRSEGEAYAGRLGDAGVPVEYHHHDGVMHEFFSMPFVIDEARSAADEASAGLRAAFGEQVPAGG